MALRLKFAFLALLLFPSLSLAQSPKTIRSTIAFQDPQGNVLANGLLTLDLTQASTILSSGGIVVPTRVSITLDATGKIPAGTLIWANDQLSPSGTSYLPTLYNSNGAIVSNLRTCPWVIQGTSPIDISQETCTNVGASYPIVVLNPISGGVSGNLLKANSATTGTDSGIAATNVPLLSASNAFAGTNQFQQLAALTVGTSSVGQSSFPFVDLFLGGGATAYTTIASLATSVRSVNFPDSSGTVLLTTTGVQEICSGQIALSTGAITSGTRATNTLACTGLSATTDAISCTFSGDTNAVTGYAPSASGGLALKTWASTNTINVDQVNDTGGSITPGAATVNCKGIR